MTLIFPFENFTYSCLRKWAGIWWLGDVLLLPLPGTQPRGKFFCQGNGFYRNIGPVFRNVTWINQKIVSHIWLDRFECFMPFFSFYLSQLFQVIPVKTHKQKKKPTKEHLLSQFISSTLLKIQEILLFVGCFMCFRNYF